MAAADLKRDIFCVSLICLPSPPCGQEANMDAAVIVFLKFQFQIGEEDWLEMAFSPSHDLSLSLLGVITAKISNYDTLESLAIG